VQADKPIDKPIRTKIVKEHYFPVLPMIKAWFLFGKGAKIKIGTYVYELYSKDDLWIIMKNTSTQHKCSCGYHEVYNITVSPDISSGKDRGREIKRPDARISWFV
jgi:hypothetical protein